MMEALQGFYHQRMFRLLSVCQLVWTCIGTYIAANGSHMGA